MDRRFHISNMIDKLKLNELGRLDGKSYVTKTNSKREGFTKKSDEKIH